MKEKLQKTVWKSGCSSWYANESGKNTVIWPGFSVTLRRKLAKLQTADFVTTRLSDLKLKVADTDKAITLSH